MPRRVISESTKRKAVQDWKSGKRSAKQIQTELKVTSGMLSRWAMTLPASDDGKEGMEEKQKEAAPPPVPAPVEAPTTNGPETALSKSKKPRADKETKARAVAEYLKGGKSAKELASEYGVRDVTIYAWAKAARKKGAAAPSGEPVQSIASMDPFRMFSQSIASMDIARLFLTKAVGRIHMISCPNCAHRFPADPPDLTACLVTIAAHVAAGEAL